MIDYLFEVIVLFKCCVIEGVLLSLMEEKDGEAGGSQLYMQ